MLNVNLQGVDCKQKWQKWSISDSKEQKKAWDLRQGEKVVKMALALSGEFSCPIFTWQWGIIYRETQQILVSTLEEY